MKTPILSIDFDGVLNSYKSGWQGARNIPDPPVLGAVPWLRSLLSAPECVCAMAPRYLDFDVRIFSSRSRYIGGRRAIKKWLFKQFEAIGEPGQCVELLKFPLWKPPSFLHIDDRAWLFRGLFPSVEEMKAFKPWNKKPSNRIVSHVYLPKAVAREYGNSLSISFWFARTARGEDLSAAEGMPDYRAFIDVVRGDSAAEVVTKLRALAAGIDQHCIEGE